MDKFTGFFKTTSWLIFLAALLWSYTSLPFQVTYRIDNTGASLAVMEKGTFFFVSLGFFLLFNIVCIIFLRTLRRIKSEDDGSGLRNRSLKLDVITWVNGFIGILNFFFALILFFVAYMNGSEEFHSTYIAGLIYIGPALILIWFFYLARILSKKRD